MSKELLSGLGMFAGYAILKVDRKPTLDEIEENYE